MSLAIAFDRQSHRDLEDPEWARVEVLSPTGRDAWAALDHARTSNGVVEASGLGVFDALLDDAPDLQDEGRSAGVDAREAVS